MTTSKVRRAADWRSPDRIEVKQLTQNSEKEDWPQKGAKNPRSGYSRRKLEWDWRQKRARRSNADKFEEPLDQLKGALRLNRTLRGIGRLVEFNHLPRAIVIGAAEFGSENNRRDVHA